MTGTYSHVNGVTTLATLFGRSPGDLREHAADAGYQTAMIGKWHLGHGGVHDPVCFDCWDVLPDQRDYHDYRKPRPRCPSRPAAHGSGPAS